MAKNRQYIRQSGRKGGFRGKQDEDIQDQNIDNEQYEEDDAFLDLSEELESATDFWEHNQKSIIGGVAILVLLIGGYLAYKYMYQAPRAKNAVEAIQKAQYQFERDSFALALDNPGAGYEGFLDIISNYSGTPTANLANYYAGISYLNLGKYDAAIEYLEDYSANDDVTPITKNGAIGDAHAELGDLDKAASFYNKAISAGNNQFLTPIYLYKLAMLKMSQGDNDGSSKLMDRIANEYPNSIQAKEAEKYVLN